MKTIIAFATAIIFAACTPAKKEPSPEEKHPEAKELAVPTIPAGITDPQERSAYLLLHFWDSLDFADRSASLDTALMEQSFANFAAIMHMAVPSRRAEAVDTMMSRALRAGQDVYLFTASVADRYLFDPSSPLFSEELYEPFALFAADDAPDAFAAKEKLRIIDTNRAGRKLPDFTVSTADGCRISTRDFAGKPFILFFYEPGCGNCRQAAFDLMADSAIGNLPVLAIYLGDDDEAWRRHLGEMPAGWTVARDTGRVVDSHHILYIRATPSIALISAEGVLMRWI